MTLSLHRADRVPGSAVERCFGGTVHFVRKMRCDVGFER